MRYDAILFDFDGTIADTLPGIGDALKAAAETLGLAPFPDELTSKFIGPPILVCAQRYLGMTPEEAERYYMAFRAAYDGTVVSGSRIYTGIPQLLRQLRAEGAYVAVASAKPQALVQRLLDHFGLMRFFDRVVGKRTIDAEVSKEAILRSALPARYSRAAMVGDRMFDMDAAKVVGLDAVGVSWGFGTEEELTAHGADAVAHTTQEAAEILIGAQAPVQKGFFISIEGLDGCGKTTQINAITEHIRRRGYEVVHTREPGGTPIAEDIRALILDPEKTMCPETEALLYAASRCEHVRKVIRPALESGRVVLCDRFVDSSIAYQGAGRELGMETVAQINAPAVDGTMPDLTLLFALDPETAFLRRSSATKLDRLERSGEAFFKRTRDGYDLLADMYPQRIRRIDASHDVETIAREACAYIDKLLSGR